MSEEVSPESDEARTRVFISSALGELAPEREAAKSAVRTLRLSPVSIELGAGGQDGVTDRPPDPSEAEVFVGIYWQSYGWVDEGGGTSDLEQQLARSEGRSRLLYVKEPAPGRDPELSRLLESNSTDSRTQVQTFEAPGDLAEMLVEDLAVLLAGRGIVGEPEPELPEGTLTFMFCDIQGSTVLLRALGPDFPTMLADYHHVVGTSAKEHGGSIADMDGDRAFVVFPDAVQAVEAAIAVQTALAESRWQQHATVRCRIGLHTGTAVLGTLGYVGLDVHRAARITSAAHGGQIVASTSVRTLTETIPDRSWSMRELGSFALKGLSRSERLFQVEAAGLVTEFPPPRARSSAKVRLPVSHGTLIGRHREIQEIAAMVTRPNVRLVTLTGPAGVGKTRVALAAAEELSDSFPDGVYFVSLAAVSDTDHVAAAIAEASGIPVEGDALEAVSEAFQHQQVLLVLDNFEQVVAGAPMIGALLGASPGLEVLVTSRVVLRIAGEHEYPIEALGTPALDRTDPGSIAESTAAQLFMDRAGTVLPGFRLTAQNAEAVATITRLVEGLPLALELAAARLRTMSPQALATRLGESLGVLGRGAADLPERQQTLDAAIDWSFRLLSEPEQRLFARLGVFCDGFTLDSAQEVGADDGDVLDLLASLVDNSMVLPVQGGSGRMRMLAPIRDFALARLKDSGELDVTRERHARHFVQLSESAGPTLKGPRQAEAIEALQDEWANLETAARWLVASEHWEDSVRLFQGMWIFVWIGNHIPEARDWLLAFPSPPPDLTSVTRGHYWWLLGGTAYEMGDYDAALAAIDEALPILEANDDQEVLAWALFMSGLLRPAFGAEPSEVMTQLGEVLTLFEANGDRWGEGYALIGCGIMASATGDFSGAERFHTRCRELAVELGNDVLLGHAETQLGFTALAAGRADDAREALRRAVDVFRPLRYREGICYALEAVAALSFGEERFEMGMIALGAAEGVRDKIRLRPWPAVMWFFDMLTGVADGLADPRLQAARHAGRDMSPFDAVDLVLETDHEMGTAAAS